MRKYLILLALLVVGCRGVPVETVEVDVIPRVMDATVGLIEDGEVIPYCTGVWVSAESILTAQHCVGESVSYLLEEELDSGHGRDIRYVLQGDFKSSFEKASVYRKLHVVGMDGVSDLALLRVDGEVPLHGVAVVGSRVRVGERLHVVGHVQGLSWTYMEGLVSAFRDKEGISMLQVSAPIYFGVSGGGAFNKYGDLVGITSFIYRAPNIGFFSDIVTINNFLKKYKL
jgi:S1-C subfamily serine protease